jgi:hypothetical protein
MSTPSDNIFEIKITETPPPDKAAPVSPAGQTKQPNSPVVRDNKILDDFFAEKPAPVSVPVPSVPLRSNSLLDEAMGVPSASLASPAEDDPMPPPIQREDGTLELPDDVLSVPLWSLPVPPSQPMPAPPTPTPTPAPKLTRKEIEDLEAEREFELLKKEIERKANESKSQDIFWDAPPSVIEPPKKSPAATQDHLEKMKRLRFGKKMRRDFPVYPSQNTRSAAYNRTATKAIRSPQEVPAAGASNMSKMLGQLLGGGKMGQLAGLAAGAVGGGAAGGMASLAAGAAGGPVGMAILAASVAADGMAKAMKGGRQIIEGFGHAVADVAGNQGMGLLKKGVEGYASALESIPIIGNLMAEGLRLQFAPIFAIAESVNALAARGKELSGYDSSLATANAEAEARKLEADIREASRTGSAIADLTTAVSKAETSFQDAMGPIKNLLAKALTPFMEKVAARLEQLAEIAEASETLMADTSYIAVEIQETIGVFAKLFPTMEFLLDLWAGQGQEKTSGEDINKLFEGIIDLQFPNSTPTSGGEIRTTDGPLGTPIFGA